ncbi:MAG: hypothetical protein KKA73_25155 [Chloroflexi bacterium]|nr:hypothetical protein [Chloroflexota bacterium]MBU1750986.1 hypothetical protein [Chloroflexota bacterium]
MARGTFQNGNQVARQPDLAPDEQTEFCRRIESLLDRLNWDDMDLDNHLGYRSNGRWTRLIRHGHPPSRFYRQRLAALAAAVEAGHISPKPAWAPLVIYNPANAPQDAVIPLARVAGAPRQCLECVAQFAEGRLENEGQTWWVFAHTRSHVCPAHKRAWRRRRAWFQRCQALGCPHVEEIPHLTTHTCRQLACSLRRRSWVQTWTRGNPREKGRKP